MASQNSLDKTYIQMAKCWSQLSHAKRKKVGCLIVKDGFRKVEGDSQQKRIFPRQHCQQCQSNKIE